MEAQATGDPTRHSSSMRLFPNRRCVPSNVRLRGVKVTASRNRALQSPTVKITTPLHNSLAETESAANAQLEKAAV
eukprot:7800651-Alexandrium_andersonii.AAC.1